MATMDVFNAPQFSVASLSGMVDRLPYSPSLLGTLNLFQPMPVRNRNVLVDRRNGRLQLIQTSADGAPPDVLEKEDRDLVSLRTTRLTKRFTLYAYELDGIRAFGSESEVMQVAAEYTRRAARLKADMTATHEHHRLGALQGILLDADGTTVIRDYFTEFGVDQPAPVALDFRRSATGIRGQISTIRREMIRNSGGALTEATQVHSLIGDAAYDALITHPEVERTYLNWAAAADLRGGIEVFGSFTFGGITWHNYRGTDDQSAIAIAPNAVRLFPVGAADVFVKAMAPYEGLGYLGTAGQDTYMINVPDRDRDQWTKGEIYSYPLYMCQRPDALRRGTVQVGA